MSDSGARVGPTRAFEKLTRADCIGVADCDGKIGLRIAAACLSQRLKQINAALAFVGIVRFGKQLADPHLDVNGAHVLRWIAQRLLRPVPCTGEIMLDWTAARKDRHEAPDRIGIAELGGTTQSLIGLGAGDKVRLVWVAVEGIEVVE